MEECPDHKGTPLEIAIHVPPTYAKGPSYHVLILDSKGNGYDRVIISSAKDVSQKVAELREGERSAWIEEKFVDSQGQQKKGRFYFYVIRLQGREDFRLYQSAINTAENLTLPADSPVS
jgi:hypothetical protein